MKGLGGLVAVAVVTAAASWIVFGAGGGDASGPSEGAGSLAGDARVGARDLAQVPKADCTLWREGSLSERLTAVTELGHHFGSDSEFWTGAKLGDREAYEVLDATCEPDHARRIKLYKIYARALAFRGLAESS